MGLVLQLLFEGRGRLHPDERRADNHDVSGLARRFPNLLSIVDGTQCVNVLQVSTIDIGPLSASSSSYEELVIVELFVVQVKKLILHVDVLHICASPDFDSVIVIELLVPGHNKGRAELKHEFAHRSPIIRQIFLIRNHGDLAFKACLPKRFGSTLSCDPILVSFTHPPPTITT